MDAAAEGQGPSGGAASAVSPYTAASAKAYVDDVARLYMAVADTERVNEELLDEVASLEERAAAIAAELTRTDFQAASLRSQAELADVESARAAREDVSLAEEHASLRLESGSLSGPASASRESLSYDDDPAALSRLIYAKTRLAELTEQRDRAKLARKELEDHIGQVKLRTAMLLTTIDDDEGELSQTRGAPAPDAARKARAHREHPPPNHHHQAPKVEATSPPNVGGSSVTDAVAEKRPA
ncbi:hypothetical protein M885DRAFT_508531 [Pelagophyceae sp. CCMP2097]|nr:hypothetical protein M885DRAFT_508531 [Pelagophyceae sp. CCMP2097]